MSYFIPKNSIFHIYSFLVLTGSLASLTDFRSNMVMGSSEILDKDEIYVLHKIFLYGNYLINISLRLHHNPEI